MSAAAQYVEETTALSSTAASTTAQATLAEGQAELMGKRVGELKKMALEKGVTENTLEACDDEENPKEAVIQLILAEQAGNETSQSEMNSMKKSQLMKLAKNMGIEVDLIAAANDELDAHDALVKLILNYKALGSLKEFNVTRDDDEVVWKSVELANSTENEPCLETVKQGKRADLLGTGGFGTVVAAKILPHGQQQTMQWVVAKANKNILNEENFKHHNLEEFEEYCEDLGREIRALRNLKHPYLINIVGVA